MLDLFNKIQSLTIENISNEPSKKFTKNEVWSWNVWYIKPGPIGYLQKKSQEIKFFKYDPDM